jgi:hypothetical protein
MRGLVMNREERMKADAVIDELAVTAGAERALRTMES